MVGGPLSVQPWTARGAEAFDLRSAAGLSYRISVGLPFSYQSGHRAYPVIYALDADFLFGTMLEMTRMRGMMGEISEVIVVGIGYPLDQDLMTAGARRTFDGSITADWDLELPAAQEAAAVFAAMGTPLQLGGAPQFLDFIVDEVQTLVADRYRVQADDYALFGDSTNGNFATYALFTRPEAFGKYIIGSPGYCYNDFEALRLEERYASTHSDLSATVHLGVGAAETMQFATSGLVSGTVRMAEALAQRRYPNLQLTCDILEGETHVPALVRVMNRGLDRCWPGAVYQLSDGHAEAVIEDLRGIS